MYWRYRCVVEGMGVVDVTGVVGVKGMDEMGIKSTDVDILFNGNKG